MLTRLKRDTDNFLHTNPSLYLAFNGENDQSMGDFLLDVFRQYGVGPGSAVLDVGSGTGREVARLDREGYRAVGLDLSEEMLEWARETHPGLPFHFGDQTNFALGERFDALYCVGSTFLYNFTNDMIVSSLRRFREHLREGGLLYLDMRNAAFFLTPEGRRWLTEELAEQRTVDGTVVSLKTRFSIDLANQLLERDYCWTVEGTTPIVEHLRHRLLFPQELVYFLTSNGFRVLQLFDRPEPHISKSERVHPLRFEGGMSGRRMQVIAQATSMT